MNKQFDDVTLRNLLSVEFPDESDDGLDDLVRLLSVYRRLPEHLRPKMHDYVSRISDGDQRAFRLGQRVADGEITLNQMLATLHN